MATVDRELTTRRIRDAADIVDLVGSYLTLTRSGSSFKACCPFHEEKTPSFHVHPARQTFRCFGCNTGGDVFTFVMLREKVDFVEARRMLAERAGISLEHEEYHPAGGPNGSGGGFGKSELARANGWAQRVFQKQYNDESGRYARDYVAKRQISAESVEKFGIGLAVDSYESLVRQAERNKVDLKLLAAAGLLKERQSGGHYDTFRQRLMFPIMDVGNRILGFGGRTLGDDNAKYLNTPATMLFDKSSHLFGLDQARQGIAEAGRAIVVEGYTDCIMAHQCGFPETVATLGTAMTENHARLLKRYTDRVILLFDSDEAGQRAADRAITVTIATGLDVALARVPSGKDPCDYLLSAGKSEFDGLLNQAVGALEFKWNGLAARFNASDSGPGRRRAIDEYLQQLADWVARGALDSIQLGLLLNQLGGILALPTEELHRQIRTRARDRSGRSGSFASARNGTVSDTAASYMVSSPEGAFAVSPKGTSAGSAKSEEESRGTDSDTFATPVWARSANAEQRAYREIIEVLLNAPEHYPAVVPVLDSGRIDDPALSSIVAELKRIFEACVPFRLDELIGRFESPGYARLITELQWRGERRGGYRGTIEGALACLSAYPQARRASQWAQEIRARKIAAGNETPTDEDERLLALSQGLKASHFATVRARQRFLQDAGDMPDKAIANAEASGDASAEREVRAPVEAEQAKSPGGESEQMT